MGRVQRPGAPDPKAGHRRFPAVRFLFFVSSFRWFGGGVQDWKGAAGLDLDTLTFWLNSFWAFQLEPMKSEQLSEGSAGSAAKRSEGKC